MSDWQTLSLCEPVDLFDKQNLKGNPRLWQYSQLDVYIKGSLVTRNQSRRSPADGKNVVSRCSIYVEPGRLGFSGSLRKLVKRRKELLFIIIVYVDHRQSNMCFLDWPIDGATVHVNKS